MALFTVEVAGRPVLVFHEQNPEAAEELVATLIGPDLQEFEAGGEPLWDGQSELLVRAAGAEEATRWQEGLAEAREGGDGQDEEEFAVFLVQLDETDEAEGDDEEA